MDLTQIEFLFVNPWLGHWAASMHWVYRKTWDSKHKVPGKPKEREASELYGNYFIALRELCKECCFHLNRRGESLYLHAAEWFQAVVQEDLFWSLAGALHRARQNGRSKLLKTDALKQHRKVIIAPLKGPDQRLKPIKLEDGQVITPPKAAKRTNPFPPCMRHIHCLIDIAIELSNTSDQFERNYYKPLIQSLEKWVKHVETNPEFAMAWVEDGTVFVQDGQGRGKHREQLDPEILKILRERGFKF